MASWGRGLLLAVVILAAACGKKPTRTDASPSPRGTTSDTSTLGSACAFRRWCTISTVNAPDLSSRTVGMVWSGRVFLAIEHTTMAGAILDPSRNVWTRMPPAPIKPPAGFPQMRWLADRLVVSWNIGDQSNAHVGGLLFDLATNEWSVMSADGAPYWRDVTRDF